MLASTGSSSGGGNFLIPNGTFIVELIIFIVVLGIVAKFILPPIQRAMDERQSTIRAAINASDEGHAEADRLSAERLQVLEQARTEARSIMEHASAQVNEMFEEARSKGQQEHDRLVSAAEARIATELGQLREASLQRLGDLVVRAASQVIGSSIDSNKHGQLINDVVSSSRAGIGSGA